jgi:hypothetical protein
MQGAQWLIKSFVEYSLVKDTTSRREVVRECVCLAFCFGLRRFPVSSSQLARRPTTTTTLLPTDIQTVKQKTKQKESKTIQTTASHLLRFTAGYFAVFIIKRYKVPVAQKGNE